MSCLGKRKEEEEDQDQDLASEALAGSHVHHAQGPPKKTLKKEDSADDSNDDVVVCEISKNRRVSVRHWQGKIFIDIREYYLKDGKQMPGKKGISLTMDQWKIFRDHVETIDKAVKEN
ncbi:RNA polymerase II transcriptional coactivator KIWI isoform X2 [Cannabis sativa]|uniref:Transcriptional coactivator p15 (PC4) C-terminal domain-containing protein n=1 Tax=Cannabis sativa TaxID=3483 RepID=A0A803QZ70_CANSA|nr:RNA polymerase II transcriptional coactivator KIWI isoform X2 [Cannabis sativa]